MIFNFVLKICCLLLFFFLSQVILYNVRYHKESAKKKQRFSRFLIKYVPFIFTRRLGSIEIRKGVNRKTVRATENDLSDSAKM